jgi:alkylhydroperoxidase family enzyme
MERDDLVPMRAAGLSDRDILDANLITSYFAYVNRLADGLGISLEGDDDVLGW